MKNVTVTMEDTVAEWARLEAARRNTSVSRLVGELLAEKMRHDDAYGRAMREALEFKSFGASSGARQARGGLHAKRSGFHAEGNRSHPGPHGFGATGDPEGGGA